MPCALLGTLLAQGLWDHSWPREAWLCQPAPQCCTLTPNSSHSSPNLRVTHQAPQTIFFSCPALPSIAEGALAPGKTEDRMVTDLGMQSSVGKHALANTILPPGSQVVKSEQSAPASPGSQGRHSRQGCVCTPREQPDTALQPSPASCEASSREELSPGSRMPGFVPTQLLTWVRQKGRRFQAADRGSKSSLQSLWLHFTKVCVYQGSSLSAKCKHDP